MTDLFTASPVMQEGEPQNPTDSIFNQLLKDRIIWLGSEVKDENANIICAQMLMLAAQDPKKDIWLYINSPGGSITAGMAIYDTMPVSYTHLTLPTTEPVCRSRWSPYH